MAGLCWMAVTLVWFLSAGNSLAAVNQKTLAGLVNQVLIRYTPSYKDNNEWRSPMFSLAVTIPRKKGTYKVDDSNDSGEDVKNTIQQCDVYEGTRVVAATVLRWPDVLNRCPNGRVQWPEFQRKYNQLPMTWADLGKRVPQEGRADHAEWRTLQHINNLVNQPEQNDLMLFYVLSSPCDQKCTSKSHPANILNDIQQIRNWNNYAFVFSNVFRPRNGPEIPETNLRGAIQRLGNKIGLNNIFRCNRRDNAIQCTSCSDDDGDDDDDDDDDQVTEYCYSDQQGRSGGGGFWGSEKEN